MSSACRTLSTSPRSRLPTSRRARDGDRLSEGESGGGGVFEVEAAEEEEEECEEEEEEEEMAEGGGGGKTESAVRCAAAHREVMFLMQRRCAHSRQCRHMQSLAVKGLSAPEQT